MAKTKDVDPTTETKETPQGLTPDEMAIYQRVESEGTKTKDRWKVITEGDAEDFSLMEDPGKLPAPAQKMQDQKVYAFRWAERKPQRIDSLRNLRFPWEICNRSNTPFLKDEIDPVLGCVCRLDQMLMFRPWKVHAVERSLVNQMAENQDRGGDLKSRDGRKDDKSEWMSGPDYKITSKDEVMADEAEVDGLFGAKEDSSGLSDVEE